MVKIPETSFPNVHNFPKKCPISGLPFFANEILNGEIVPVYGGPYDAYTTPVKDDEGDLIWQRFDYDEGGWIEGGEVYASAEDLEE